MLRRAAVCPKKMEIIFMKKLFGGIKLTWPKVIISAVLIGIYTAVMAIIPQLHYTSFNSITVTFEVWIFFGILIIMNSKSNMDAALKCFVFFLISQPLVYLIQVPFSTLGWGLFGYYKYWFMWTILCFPMGYIGYFLKKNQWWGMIILIPIILLVSFSYTMYLGYFFFSWPKYILIVLFCAASMILYPIVLLGDKMAKSITLSVSVLLLTTITVFTYMQPPVYSTEIMGNNEEHAFDDTYTVSLEDEKYGDVKIIYMDEVEDYMLHADFFHEGKTVLTMVAPSGEKTEYDLTIKRDTYEYTKR